MYSEIILKPVLTEKMAILEERENKYAFFVSMKANKTEIKKAIEAKFDVNVLKVALPVGDKLGSPQEKRLFTRLSCSFWDR